MPGGLPNDRRYADELFRRVPDGPILDADVWPYPANSVFNPGATTLDGDTVLLCRVEDRRGISHLTVARSADGLTNWRIEPKPLIADDPDDPLSCWGLEDPRITHVAELACYVIAYTAYGPNGPCVALARTEDFRTVEPLGMAMPPEDKNASLIPRSIKGDFLLFHRPVSVISGRADVWLSRTDDLRSWTTPVPVLHARPGPWWDAHRVGMGPPPIETPEGWLAVYHGVKQLSGHSIYRAGLVLLDLNDPTRVLHRSSNWALGPEALYEMVGDAPNVVFPTGLVHHPETDELWLYYGAGDRSIHVATTTVTQALELLLQEPVDG